MINAQQLTREMMGEVRPSKIFFIRPAAVYVVCTSDDPQRALYTKDHALIDDLIADRDMVLVTASGTPFFTPRNEVDSNFERGYDYAERNHAIDTPAEQIAYWMAEEGE